MINHCNEAEIKIISHWPYIHPWISFDNFVVYEKREKQGKDYRSQNLSLLVSKTMYFFKILISNEYCIKLAKC